MCLPRTARPQDNLDFSDEELATIDRHAVDAGINLWAASSTA